MKHATIHISNTIIKLAIKLFLNCTNETYQGPYHSLSLNNVFKTEKDSQSNYFRADATSDYSCSQSNSRQKYILWIRSIAVQDGSGSSFSNMSIPWWSTPFVIALQVQRWITIIKKTVSLCDNESRFFRLKFRIGWRTWTVILGCRKWCTNQEKTLRQLYSNVQSPFFSLVFLHKLEQPNGRSTINSWKSKRIRASDSIAFHFKSEVFLIPHECRDTKTTLVCRPSWHFEICDKVNGFRSWIDGRVCRKSIKG